MKKNSYGNSSPLPFVLMMFFINSLSMLVAARESNDTTATELNSGRSLYYNSNYRRAVAVSAIYTFGYGKQIRRGDEIGRQSGAASAIME